MLNPSRPNALPLLAPTMGLHQLGSIDLTGAELEYGDSRLGIVHGRLGRINPETGLTNGHLSIISHIKPSLFSSRARITWRNLEFELMMISLQERSAQAELKLKFIARLLPLPKTKVLLS